MGLLRLLLALAVVIGHLPQGGAIPSIINASVAVKLFFVISGYFMVVAYPAYDDAKKFYASRAVRIFPAYWIASIAGVAVIVSTDAWQRLVTETGPVWLAVLTVSHFSLVGLDQVFQLPLPAGMMVPLPPGWSLAIEWYFYLLVPLFLRMDIRYVAGIAAASLALAACLSVYRLPLDPWLRSFFPAELHLFLFGFLARRVAISRKVGAICAIALVAVLAVHLRWIQPHITGGPFSAWNEILYLLFALSIPTFFEATKSIRLDQLASDYSYPIYLIHIPVIGALLSFGGMVPTSLEFAASVLGVTFAASVAIIFITRPLENLRDALRGKPTAYSKATLAPATSPA